MSKTKHIGKQLFAFLLAFITLVSVIPIMPVSAETLSNGKAKTVTITLNETHYILETEGGTKLQGQSWTYTSDTGITGPAYCVNWGLDIPNPNTQMTITGRYTSSPKTIGAFAGGYPQRTLEDFISINKAKHPIIANLTREEYLSATQAAVWATLGQLAIEGTEFTSGRDTLKVPTDNPSQLRAYEALMIILYNASFWDRPLLAGMHIRLGRQEAGNVLDIEDANGLIGAEQNGMYGIEKETIDGTEYYTRTFVASSATSTYKNGHTIHMYLENAPTGTILTDLSNNKLETFTSGGKKYWKIPTPSNALTNMNENGQEYVNDFKVCIPVRNTPEKGNIIFHASAIITQYDIYFANNTVAREQSFVIADPMYATMSCTGQMKWAKVTSPYGRLIVNKTDSMGNALAGAIFKLTGSDGSSYTGTSNEDGQIIWEYLNPEATYVLSELQAPEGYIIAEDIQVNVLAGTTTTVSVKNYSERALRIYKVDAQNGSPLIGATFRIEQIDGSYKTDVTTSHSGCIEFVGDELPFGSYKIYEIASPVGYEASEEMQTFKWDGVEDVSLTFENVRTPSLVIIKKDKDTDIPLKDVPFEVYKDGRLITTVTTNIAGYANVTDLSEGYYEIVEKDAPDGYIFDTERHGIYIDPYNPELEDDPVLVLTNSKKPSLIIEKLNTKTLMPIKGTAFAVYLDTELIGNYTTDADGIIEITDLAPGTYTVKETKTSFGYVLQDTPQSIELKAGQSATLTFFNPTKPGISILKTDADKDKKLEGATFRIKGVDVDYFEEFTTDRNGAISLSDLAPGVYEITELIAPEGYINSGETRVIDAREDTDVQLVFINAEKPDLKITKLDANTGKALEGASFSIVKVGDSTRYYDRTTDKNGVIELNDLDVGIYTVQEVIAPKGYLLNDTLYFVELFAGKESTLIVENKAKPSLTIKKYDSLTGEMMPDTVFEVYKDTTLVGTYTTDENGEIQLFGLVPGTYTVKEVATDDEHIVNSTPQSIEITEDSLDTAVLVFLNDRKPYIRLVKLDSQTMQPLVNASFTFKKVGDTLKKEYITDENGEIRLDNLDEGTYTGTETMAPDGYLIDDAERIVKVEGNEYATFVFTNTKKPSIKVIKYDKYNDKYLSGATFRIAKIEDGSNYLDRITDVDGSIVIDNLDPGVYSVKEIKAPTGYVLNETEYHVELFGGKQSQVVVLNEEKPSLKIVKTDAETGKPIADVGFLVRLADGSTENTAVTDANGEALLTHLDPGVYEVIEKSVPDGYLIDAEPKLVTLVPNRTSVVRFENYQKPSLTINKVDSITKDPLHNAKFNIIYASNNTFTGEINDLGSFTTDENGQIKLSNLKDGWYRITETEAPDGYQITEAVQQVYINGGEEKVLTFENIPLSALVIKKVDADTGAVLQGAVFEVRYLSGTSGTGGTVIGEYTTTANGTVVINRLKSGTYVIEEIKAPDGYIISDAPEIVYITGKEQSVINVTVENKKDGGLIITKLDRVTNKPLAGAQFSVTTSDGKFVSANGGSVSSNGIYTTDATGVIHITGIEAGTTVVVTETKAPDGYSINTASQTVKIEANDTQTLTFYNSPAGGLLITKLDKATGEPLYGAVFKITDSEGRVVGNKNGKYTTDRNGTIQLTSLEPDTYVVTEITAPDGYTLDSTPQIVKVKSGEVHELTFYNEALGGIRITKLDEETRQPIKGVKFAVEYMNGKRIGTYTTNASGVINIDDLPNGWYTVIETKAADDYILDAEPHDIEVKDCEITRVTFTNRKNSSFLIHKVDSTTGKGICGVTFLISDRYGNPVAQYMSDQNGYVYTDNHEFKDGKYYIREIGVPEGYVLDTEVKTFYVEYGCTSSITWYNTPTQAQIQIIKKSADDNPINGLPAGTLLEGAVFEIYDKAGNIVDSVKTDKNGRASSKLLPLGLYTIRETEAPAYYTANETLMTAYLEFNGQIMTFEVLNKSVTVGVSVTKYGYNEVMPDNPIVYTFKNIANTSSVALDSFYIRDTLPSAIRAEKLVTGTFNQNLSYKVVYLTNLSYGEYKTANDNLSTSKNYVIDLSPTALGLAENEYITEIMYVFGSVRARFAQVETPYLYARSVKGLANGSSFVNVADVGGVYNGQWITTVSRFVTKVYNYTYIEMPKTGY